MGLIQKIERGDKVTRLEAFVDAAFAFAVTLLVIAGDEIPTSIDSLIDALKQVPAYAASFVLIMQIWFSHAEWSRRFGLEDKYSDYLSLSLVFVLLIFVYPLKMVFASFFSLITSGYLPTKFAVANWSQVPILFQTFAIGFGAMGLIMSLLFSRAVTLGKKIGFSIDEIAFAKQRRLSYAVVFCFACLSFALTFIIPAQPESGIWIGLPGYIYFILNLLQFIVPRYYQRPDGST